MACDTVCAFQAKGPCLNILLFYVGNSGDYNVTEWLEKARCCQRDVTLCSCLKKAPSSLEDNFCLDYSELNGSTYGSCCSTAEDRFGLCHGFAYIVNCQSRVFVQSSGHFSSLSRNRYLQGKPSFIMVINKAKMRSTKGVDLYKFYKLPAPESNYMCKNRVFECGDSCLSSCSDCFYSGLRWLLDVIKLDYNILCDRIHSDIHMYSCYSQTGQAERDRQVRLEGVWRDLAAYNATHPTIRSLLPPRCREIDPSSVADNRVRECSGQDGPINSHNTECEEDNDQATVRDTQEEAMDDKKPLLYSSRTTTKSTAQKWLLNSRDWRHRRCTSVFVKN